MVVKALPKRGDRLHEHERKKYYPGVVYGVDDELGRVLISRGIAEKVEESSPRPVVKRGPGRPKKHVWS